MPDVCTAYSAGRLGCIINSIWLIREAASPGTVHIQPELHAQAPRTCRDTLARPHIALTSASLSVLSNSPLVTPASLCLFCFRHHDSPRVPYMTAWSQMGRPQGHAHNP